MACRVYIIIYYTGKCTAEIGGSLSHDNYAFAVVAFECNTAKNLTAEYGFQILMYPT